jgi:hypothetical protein
MRKYTRDHDLIRAWAEERGGSPARVRVAGLRRDAATVLRIAFGPLPPTWEPIDWPTFFVAFDENDLAFLYEENPGSRICKLVKGQMVGE